jgi:acyl dehydratase
MAGKDNIGRKYPFTWVVERGKIRELADAIGDDNPIYQDAEASRKKGYKDVVAPPTFTTVPLLWGGALFQAFDDLKIELSRTVHAEQSCEYYQEILPGDKLEGVVEVKDIKDKKGKSGNLKFIQFEITYTNQHNDLVSKDEMLVITR